MSESSDIIHEVKEYYGKVLSKSEDLKTNVCTTGSAALPHIQTAIQNIHPEVRSKYYGCGYVAPDLLTGLRVLDLGCGAGRDCYLLAQLVGEAGHVVGVDMTSELIHIAMQYQDWHREKFGYSQINTTFLQGYIEKLDELGLEEGSFDVIVSNCVVNLSPHKDLVLQQAYRLLKPGNLPSHLFNLIDYTVIIICTGGEMYFSDVYCNRRVSKALQHDSVLWGECLSGALYIHDFLRMAKQCGFNDPRMMHDAQQIQIQNEDIAQRVEEIDFFSSTFRLWKIADLETTCEDYGQAVIYRGITSDIASNFTHLKVKYFDLDGKHRFEVGKVIPVCGNTFLMLQRSRFVGFFEFIGDFTRHYGMFCDDSSQNQRLGVTAKQQNGQSSTCCF